MTGNGFIDLNGLNKLLEKLDYDDDELYSVFSSKHHLQSATRLFESLARMTKKVSVVYGHKAQGKTQFLYFIFKLLQALGEKVVFLDATIMPLEEDNEIDVDSARFCGNLWKESFQIEGEVKNSLEKFYKDSLPESFGKFMKSLRQYTRSTGISVWIIVDEVVLFEKFPIHLPKEQDLGPFNWIVTGSAGIGSWVGKRHLEKMVFDLPLFTKEECFEFSKNLCISLHINLENGIGGVPFEGIGDWIEEKFGGVVGYIAEMFLEISKGNSLSQYMLALSGRMNNVLSHSAKKDHISKEQIAKDWLNEIKSDDNNWDCLRDAGLCGSSAPRGIIFSFILKWLYTFSPKEDALSLVAFFRSKFSGDPGLDECLLELEEILKLRANQSIRASLLTRVEQGWIAKEIIGLTA
jgi:hypothetical protein